MSGEVGPVVRFTTTYTVTAATNPQVSSLLAARTKIDVAVAALRDAEAALADARSTRAVSQSIAERLQADADAAELEADAAARTYIAAAKGDGTTYSSMTAAFAAGNDLLAGLGGMARVAEITGDAKKLLEVANVRAEVAAATQERADAAWAEADAVPVDELVGEVAAAERAVTEARDALAALETRVAAISVEIVQSLPADSGQLSAQGWARPVTGRITDNYGPRPDKPLPGVNEFHRGTDVAATCGTAVFAATGGIVVEARPNGGYGNWILIDHGSGVATGYAHLDPGGTFVSPGETVSAGQPIGAVGSTGASTGCHLHYEVRLGGVAVDAVPFMAARGVPLG